VKIAPPPAQPQPTVVAESNPPITHAPEVAPKSSLTEVAKVFNETLVPVGTTNGGTPTPVASSAAGKSYKVESGDSVSKLASRFLGGNTPANRDAIVKANPSLQGDPNKLIIGRTYIIPTASAPAATNTAAPAPIAAVKASTGTAGEYIYTVKSGDSLSRIAVEQLGSASTIAAIKELNRDVLKNENTITVNMKLRLPAKPLASAN
jgi:nucleoid-associated protein YgaU